MKEYQIEQDYKKMKKIMKFQISLKKSKSRIKKTQRNLE